MLNFRFGRELCMLMKKCVEKESLSAVVANGGIEGMQLLEENKATCFLVILDIMMPDIDGFQVLLKILVLIGGVQVELTGKEFDLLSFLASNKGKVFTKKQIYTHVWEEEYAFEDSYIMSFISKLRKKIEPDPEHPFYIQTVRGVGYRFNREA